MFFSLRNINLKSAKDEADKMDTVLRILSRQQLAKFSVRSFDYNKWKNWIKKDWKKARPNEELKFEGIEHNGVVLTPWNE